MSENKNLEISSLESLLLAVGKAISTKEIEVSQDSLFGEVDILGANKEIEF